MKTSKSKSALAITVFAIIAAAIMALPGLAFKAKDAATASGGYTGRRPVRAESLGESGRASDTARALYIDHVYTSSSPGGRTLCAATQYEFDKLKNAGVIPAFCSFSTADTTTQGDCRVFVEPVSGIAVSIRWNGEGVGADELFKDYISYLEFGGAHDWQHVEYKGPYMSETTFGRYSESLQLYITAQVDDDGKTCGIDLSSHTKAEMEPLLEQYGTGEEQ